MYITLTIFTVLTFKEQQEYGVGKLEKELNTTGILMRNVTIRAAKSKGEIVQSDLRKNPYYFKVSTLSQNRPTKKSIVNAIQQAFFGRLFGV